MTRHSSSIFFFRSRCEGITSPEGSKSIVEGIIEEEEEDEEGSESVNKRKKEDDMEVSEGLVLGKTEGGEEREDGIVITRLQPSGGRDPVVRDREMVDTKAGLHLEHETSLCVPIILRPHQAPPRLCKGVPVGSLRGKKISVPACIL